jgi:hypothetical protein
MADFVINAKVSNFGPSIAGLGEGFVAVWTDVTGVHVKGQRLSASGSLIGPEFSVNTTADGDQDLAVVARVRDRDSPGFVVAWMSSRRTVLIQRFTDEGTKLGGEIQVNAFDANGSHPPALGGLPGGDFVVCWTDRRPDGGVRAQMFSSSGVKRGSEIMVNNEPGVHFAPVLTQLDPGGFVIAWQGGPQSGISGALAQVFEPDGKKLGSEIKARFRPADDKMAITFLSNDDTTRIGHFVLVYRAVTNTPDGVAQLRMVIAALFSPSLEGETPREIETNVTHRADATVAEDVAVCALPDHRIVVTWSESPHPLLGGAPNFDIKAMTLFEEAVQNPDGTVVHILTAPEPQVVVPVNSVTTGQQRMPSVSLSMLENREHICIAWHDDSVSGPDQNVRAVKGRVFSGTLQPLP